MYPVADLEESIVDFGDWLFTDPQLTNTITYRLYAGQDDDGEDTFTDVSMLAIPHQVRLRNIPDGVAVNVQGVARAFIIRAASLPVGTVVADLSTSDRISYGSSEYQVIGFDKAHGWIINVICQGE